MSIGGSFTYRRVHFPEARQSPCRGETRMRYKGSRSFIERFHLQNSHPYAQTPQNATMSHILPDYAILENVSRVGHRYRQHLQGDIPVGTEKTYVGILQNT